MHCTSVLLPSLPYPDNMLYTFIALLVTVTFGSLVVGTPVPCTFTCPPENDFHQDINLHHSARINDFLICVYGSDASRSCIYDVSSCRFWRRFLTSLSPFTI